MLDKYACLEKLAARRTDEIVVTTMSATVPWSRLSDGPLDFASVDSGMGHSADLGHGLALARPDRRVIVLNGDGSTLMCLGTLVTMAATPAPNLTLVIMENGTYEVTGNQPVPGAGTVDYAAMARAAGLGRAHIVESPGAFDRMLPLHFEGEGPVVFVWKLARTAEPVPRVALPIAERAQRLRRALLAG